MPKLDKYYTRPNIAEFCCNLFSKYVKVNKKNDVIIEPSAGNGAFIEPIRKLCNHHMFFDILPDKAGITKADFLQTSFEDLLTDKKNIYVIGNPPFGFKSSIALKFIKHSAKFCDAFGFILPRSFMKQSMKKSVPLNFHLKFNMILPENSFTKDNIPYDVPCIFQIWIKKNYLRKGYKKILPVGYKFVNRNQNPHFAIRRVGSKAGKIYFTDLELLNTNTHYFVRLEDGSKIFKIKNINIQSKYDVTAALSISKNMIIKSLNNKIL